MQKRKIMVNILKKHEKQWTLVKKHINNVRSKWQGRKKSSIEVLVRRDGEEMKTIVEKEYSN